MSDDERRADGQEDGARSRKASRGEGPVDSRAIDDRPPGEVAVLDVVNFILRHRHVFVLTSFAVALLLVGVSLVQPPNYPSTASFTPESGGGQAGRLAGLASQFGVQVPTGEAGQSPQFYANLLTGRELLRETVVTEYEAADDSVGSDTNASGGDLVELFGIEAESRPLAMVGAIEVLRDRVEVSTDPETGIVELSVTTRWPEVSRQVAQRMVELVNQFNLERRQSQASAKREFIETQVARAESALHAAEDSLEQFLQRNRSYQNSPALRFEYDRLQRRVTLHQQIFTSLSESYEQARIDEVRNTPVITVVQPPDLPARPAPRRLVFKGILGLILGGLLGGIWAFGREVLATSQKRDPDDYAEFERLKRETKDEVSGLWRGVRSLFR